MNKDLIRNLLWVLLFLALFVLVSMLSVHYFHTHNGTETLPSTAVVDTAPRMDPVGKSVSVSVSANVAFSADRPAPPVDSVVITNGEEQLRILMARRKPIVTNVPSQVINQ